MYKKMILGNEKVYGYIKFSSLKNKNILEINLKNDCLNGKIQVLLKTNKKKFVLVNEKFVRSYFETKEILDCIDLNNLKSVKLIQNGVCLFEDNKLNLVSPLINKVEQQKLNIKNNIKINTKNYQKQYSKLSEDLNKLIQKQNIIELQNEIEKRKIFITKKSKQTDLNFELQKEIDKFVTNQHINNLELDYQNYLISTRKQVLSNKMNLKCNYFDDINSVPYVMKLLKS